MDEPGVHAVGAGGNAAGEGGIVVGKGSGLGGTLGAGTRERAQAWAFAVADKASSLVQVPDQSPSRCIWNADALSPHYMRAKD